MLVVIALLLGIVSEGISIYRGILETKTAAAIAANADALRRAEAQKMQAEATTATETAKNAERRARAEADRVISETTSAFFNSAVFDERMTPEQWSKWAGAITGFDRDAYERRRARKQSSEPITSWPPTSR